MTDNTHTDNEELRRKLTHIVQGAATNDNAITFPESYVEEIMQLFAPTKSSGELEEIVSQKLSEYSLHMREIHAGGCSYEDDDQTCNCGHSWDFNQYPRFMKALVTSLHLWHTTQTTKLQAEARQLVSDLWSKEVVNTITDLDDTTYAKIRDAFQEALKKFAQLEREHKIGEDGDHSL